MDFNFLISVLVAIFLGALIGLEREIYLRTLTKVSTKAQRVSDIRSHIFLSFLGFLSAYLAQFSHWSIGGIAFLIVGSFVLTGYILEFQKYSFLGITSELSSILTFLVGFLTCQDFSLAIVVAILVTITLSLKEKVVFLAKRIEKNEFHATLKFLIIAFVVLPILPKEPVDPWGIISIYDTWLMVVFISGISFVGYILTKTLGAEKGIGLAAIIGGLASSTAVTTSMSSQSKKNNKIINPFVFGVVIASMVMFARVGFEVFVINMSLLGTLTIPLVVMGITSLIVLLVLFLSEKKKDKKHEEIPLTSPFQFAPALKFGLFYIFVLLISHFSHQFFGDNGIYLSSVLAGLADVDAITISMSKLAASGSISHTVATRSIIIAVFSNTLVKGSIALFFGGKDFAKKVSISFAIITLVGLGSLFFI